ncbi:hypothetical protein VTJ04DRAFT_3792 [Mycothermus thermophilus]|uniref:uncharacterized protein n=1 Tax=Humicola insolens TaxID=85995 RepID=UPI003743B362
MLRFVPRPHSGPQQQRHINFPASWASSSNNNNTTTFRLLHHHYSAGDNTPAIVQHHHTHPHLHPSRPPIVVHDNTTNEHAYDEGRSQLSFCGEEGYNTASECRCCCRRSRRHRRPISTLQSSDPTTVAVVFDA